MDAQAMYFGALLRSGRPTDLRLVRADNLSADWRPVLAWVAEFVRREGALPRPETLEHQFSRPLPSAPEDVRYYAHEIEQGAMRLAMEDGFTEKVVAPLRDTKAIQALEGAKQVVSEVSRRFRSTERTGLAASMGEGVDRRLADYRLRKASQDCIGIPLPWQAITQATGGVVPSSFWVLLARQGQGKSWLLIVLSVWWWQMGLRVLFVSMETPPEAPLPRDPAHRVLHGMCIRCYQRPPQGACPAAEVPRQLLSVRFDAVAARLSAWRLLKGLLTPQEERQLAAYYEALAGGRTAWGDLRVIAAPRVASIHDLSMEIAEYRPDVWLWDSAYLAVEDGARRNDMASALIKDTRQMIEDTGVPGVLSWHFNRDVDENATNASIGSAILTDEISRIPDVVMGLFRPPEHEAAGEAILRTLKVRDGVSLRELRVHFKVRDEINFAEIGTPPDRRAE